MTSLSYTLDGNYVNNSAQPIGASAALLTFDSLQPATLRVVGNGYELKHEINTFDLFASDGQPLMYTNAGYDFDFLGMSGPLTVAGGIFNDIIRGGSGNDKITGGKGSDSLYGGAGADRIAVGPRRRSWTAGLGWTS